MKTEIDLIDPLKSHPKFANVPFAIALWLALQHKDCPGWMSDAVWGVIEDGIKQKRETDEILLSEFLADGGGK